MIFGDSVIKPRRIKSRIERMVQDGFIRNVGVLTGGTVISQAVVALSMPLLTRLYDPQDFSLLAIYTALLSMLTVISCLRFNIAISLPQSDHDGANLVALSLIAASAMSVVLVIITLVAPDRLAELLGQPTFAQYLWMVPVGVLLSSSYAALQYWTSRQKRFGLITRTRVTRAIGGAGTQSGIGAIHPSPFGLIFGHMIYNSLGVVGLVISAWRHDRSSFRNISWISLKRNFIEYRRFPIYSVPEALFNSAGSQLPILIIAGSLAGPEAGFLLLAMRVLGLPMSLIGSSVAQVYLAEAPGKLRDGELTSFTRKAIWSLLKTGAPPLLALGVVSPFLFPIIFGEEWARAGWMLLWMTPWFILQFVSSPISMLLHVVGRQVTALTLQIFGCALRVGAVIAALGIATGWTVEVYALSGAAFYAAYIAILVLQLRRIDRQTVPTDR